MMRSTSTPPLLEIEHLDIRFPVRRDWRGRATEFVDAGKDVSLTAHEGETVGVVGESGSGKTTLALAVVGLVEPISGSIRFRGREWTGSSGASHAERARSCQIVFQDPLSSLDPRLRVWQIISESLEIRGRAGRAERRARAEELARQVGLEGIQLDRYPHEFSGGQRQRIAIARALAGDPELLLLDEPTSALDVSVQAQVLNLLLRLQRELGLTYLLVSHDVSVINHMCDRVAVMHNGEIVEHGNTERVLGDPERDYTRSLLQAVPRIGGPRVRAAGVRT